MLKLRKKLKKAMKSQAKKHWGKKEVKDLSFPQADFKRHSKLFEQAKT